MRTIVKTCIVLFLSTMVCSAAVTLPGGITLSFVETPKSAGPSLLKELKRGRLAQSPKLSFKNYGPLTNIAAGQITNITVTWVDERRYPTHSAIENSLRKLLTASKDSCETFPEWRWAEVGPENPPVVASVDHREGTAGYILLYDNWHDQRIRFGYRNDEGQWWFGIWHPRRDAQAPTDRVGGPSRTGSPQ